MPKWPKEEILASLRAAGEETGHWWTLAAWRAAHRRPYPEQVFAVCGSWSQAWVEVGFPPPERWQSPTSRRWTDAEIAEAVRRAADGRPLSFTRYDRLQREGRDLPCGTTVKSRFGSWEAARAAAGVTSPRREVSRAEAVEAVAALWREIGRPPTCHNWDSWEGRPCSTSYLRKAVAGGMPALRGATLAEHADLPRSLARSKALRRLLAVPREILTEREREIAARAEHGETLREIGEAVGFSVERIRQIALHGARRRVRHGSVGQVFTNEEMALLLRRHFEETGRIPTIQNWIGGRGKPSVTAVLRRFGTWYAAWETALGSDHAALADLRRRGGARGRRRSA